MCKCVKGRKRKEGKVYNLGITQRGKSTRRVKTECVKVNKNSVLTAWHERPYSVIKPDV